jgi:hypothetical protein
VNCPVANFVPRREDAAETFIKMHAVNKAALDRVAASKFRRIIVSINHELVREKRDRKI